MYVFLKSRWVGFINSNQPGLVGSHKNLTWSVLLHKWLLVTHLICHQLTLPVGCNTKESSINTLLTYCYEIFTSSFLIQHAPTYLSLRQEIASHA